MLLEQRIVIVSVVDPVVLSLEAQPGGTLFEREIQRYEAMTVSHPFEIGPERNRYPLRHQVAEGRERPSVRDDPGCGELHVGIVTPVWLDPDTDRRPIRDDDLRHSVIDQALAAVCGDDFGDALGDGPGATNRIVPAAQITGHYEGMNRERALGRRQAVISPLRGEHRFELGVTHMFVEVGGRRGKRERPPRAAGDPNERSHHARDSLCENLRAEPATYGVEVSEVRLDRSTLVRVSRDQRLPIARFIVRLRRR